MSPTHCGNRRGTRGRVPDREVTLVSPPEGLVGFSQSLFLCDADVLEHVKVVALRNLAQHPTLAGSGEPSADSRARAGDEPADRRFEWEKTPGAISLASRVRAFGMTCQRSESGAGPGLGRPDGAGSIGASRHCRQSIVSRGCPSFIHGGGVASLSPTAERAEVI
jgi:hypothetical protein